MTETQITLPELESGYKFDPELEAMVKDDPAIALMISYYAPSPDLDDFQKMDIAAIGLRSEKLPNEFKVNRAIMIPAPMWVMDHLTATIINLLMTPVLNDRCAEYLEDVKKIYPAKYKPYIRDIGRLAAANKLKTPPGIPKIKDQKFEDPFGIGNHHLKKLARKVSPKELHIITRDYTVESFPENIPPVLQSNISISLIDQISRWQAPGADVIQLWNNYCQKFDAVDYGTKFRVFLALHDHFSPHTALDIFGYILEEFFARAPAGGKNNITSLLIAYYHIEQTNDAYFSYHLEQKPALKQRFMDLAVGGDILESAFALKVLAGYAKRAHTKDRISEIARFICPNLLEDQADKKRIYIFLQYFDDEIKENITFEDLNVNESTENPGQPEYTKQPASTDPAPQGSIVGEYRFMIAETVRRRLSHSIVPQKKLPYEDYFDRPVAEKIAFYEDALAELFRLKNDATPKEIEMIETIENRRALTKWASMRSESTKLFTAEPVDPDQLSGFLCIPPPNHAVLKKMNTGIVFNGESKFVLLHPGANTRRVATVKVVDGMSYLAELKANNFDPTDPDSELMPIGKSSNMAVLVLDFLCGGRLIPAAEGIIQDLKPLSIEHLLHQIQQPKMLTAVKKLHNQSFDEPAQSGMEQSYRYSMIVHALFMAYAMLESKNDHEKAHEMLKQQMKLLRSRFESN